MQNLHIDSLEDIVIGKIVNNEIVIDNNFLMEEERVIKTIYQTTANSGEKVNSLRMYVLTKSNKTLDFLDSHNITEQQYNKYLNSIQNKN